jgi:hypothetical protein
MGKDGKKKQVANRFETGRHGGCEALLYEFREKSPADTKPTAPESVGLDELHTVRIAANTFDEALEYLRWHQPHLLLTVGHGRNQAQYQWEDGRAIHRFTSGCVGFG